MLRSDFISSCASASSAFDASFDADKEQAREDVLRALDETKLGACKIFSLLSLLSFVTAVNKPPPPSSGLGAFTVCFNCTVNSERKYIQRS